uniref:L1 transposable element RRM domain-containing protein n=1 Tax=Photinus pyralis TaxID=7054 RepID=A0A1Y1K7U3_PHOPY
MDALVLQLQAITERLSKLDDINTIVTQLSVLNENVSDMNTTILRQGEKIDMCVKNITDLKQENETLHVRISELESKLKSTTSEAVQEMQSRIIRQNNVILLGVDESTSAENQVAEILNDITPGYINFESTQRLGHATSKKPRPLKVIFNNPSDALRLLKAKSKIPRTKYPNLQLKNDKTPLQIKECSEAYNEMLRRKKAGENVALRFLNNTPTVVVVRNKRGREDSPDHNAPKSSKKGFPPLPSQLNVQQS